MPLRSRYDREILRLAVPALGALAAEPLYVLVDTAVVGHLGTSQLGGLAVAASILTTGFLLFNFLAYGTTASVARLEGAGHEGAAAHQAVQALWLAAAAGVAVAVIGALAASPLVGLFGASEAVRSNAVVYLRVSLVGAPAALVALVGVGYLRGTRDIRTTLVVAVASNLANLVIELVLVFGLGFGIAASAAATVVAQFGAAAVYLATIVRRALAAGVGLRPHRGGLGELAGMGWALVVRTGSLLGALALATSVAARLGDVALAAHQIAFQVWSLLALALDAVAIAGQAIVGRLLGSGAADEARGASRRMIGWGFLAGVAFGVVVLAVRAAAVPLFTPDAAVVEAAVEVLVVVALLQPLNGVVFVLDGILIGAGDLRYLAGAMAASLVIFVPAALAVAALDGPLLALWGAVALLMAGRLAGTLARFRGPAWQVVGARAGG